VKDGPSCDDVGHGTWIRDFLLGIFEELFPEVAAAAMFNRLRLSWRLSERVMFNDGLLGIVALALTVLLEDDGRRTTFLLGMLVIVLGVLPFLSIVRVGMLILDLLLNVSSDVFS